MCKISAYIGIKGNDAADKAAKDATYMPEMASTRLLYTDYYPIFRKTINSQWTKGVGKSTIKLY